MRFQKLATLLVVFALMTSSVGVVAASPEKPECTPTIGGFVSYSVSDCVVQFSDDRVGIIVEFDQTKVSSLQDWADSDDTRDIRYLSGDGLAVLTVNPSDTGLSFLDDLRGNGLASLAYVEDIHPDVYMTLDLPEPASEDDYDEPTSLLRGVTASDFPQDGVAYSDDAAQTTLSEARSNISADGLSYDGSGVSIAVIDTGVNFANGQVFGTGTDGSNIRVGGLYDAINDQEDLNSSDGWNTDLVSDSNYHGTWVATAAVGVNGSAPGATLYAAKALDANGGGSTSSIIRAIDWAQENNVDIISMSLGSEQPQPVLEEQVQDYLDNGGSAVVVAAGNNRMTTRWTASPADSESVISVAAVTNNPAANASLAYFSAVGSDPLTIHDSSPTVAAPGVKVVASIPDEDGNLFSKELSGTSMATPLVSGAIALELEDDPSKTGDYEAVKESVETSAVAVPNAGITEVGSGMVSASNLVNDVETTDSQEDARTTQAEGRDGANYALSADGLNILDWLL
jgi:subtilisin family serine protease